MGPNRHAELQHELERLAGAAAAEHGVELVELSLRGPSGRRLLRVDIDRPGPGGITVADCQRVSQSLGLALDESALIDARYLLEVSSPGVDRPIVTADDYRRNVGRKVVIVADGVGGKQQRFRGELLGLEGGLIRLRDDRDSETRVPLAEVVGAQQDVAF